MPYCLIFLLLLFPVNAEAIPGVEQIVTYDEFANYGHVRMISHPDGGLLIGADIEMQDGHPGFWISRIAGNGDQIWSRTVLGVSNDDSVLILHDFYDILPTPDGGCIAIGDANGRSRRNIGEGYYRVCLNADGEQVWDAHTPDRAFDTHDGHRLMATQDESFYLVGQGHIQLEDNTYLAAHVVKFSSEDGILISEDSYPFGGPLVGVTLMTKSVSQFENDFVISGTSFAGGEGGDAWIVRMNFEGEQIWSCQFDRATNSAQRVIPSRDGNLVFMGSETEGGQAVTILGGCTADGEQPWSQSINPNIFVLPNSMFELPNGDFIGGGSQNGIGDTPCQLFGCDSQGNNGWLIDPGQQYSDITDISFDNEAHRIICVASAVDHDATSLIYLNFPPCIVSHYPSDTDIYVFKDRDSTLRIDALDFENDEFSVWWQIDGERVNEGSELHINFDQLDVHHIRGFLDDGAPVDSIDWWVEVVRLLTSHQPREDSLTRFQFSEISFSLNVGIPPEEAEFVWYVGDSIISNASECIIPFEQAGDFVVQAEVSWRGYSEATEWFVHVIEYDGVHKDSPAADPPLWATILSVNPNPFNSTLTIRYADGLEPAATRLAIYDVNGREVAKLHGSTGVSAGRQGIHPAAEGRATVNKVTWDASAQPAGIHFVRLQAGSEVVTQKVVLMR